MSQLFELVYFSQSTPKVTDEEAQCIAHKASLFNKQNNITGLLCFDGQYFLQIIEGAEDDIKKLYEAIKQDERHSDVELLHKGVIEERSFADWTMAFKPVENAKLTAAIGAADTIRRETAHEKFISQAKSYGSQLFSLFMISAYEA